MSLNSIQGRSEVRKSQRKIGSIQKNKSESYDWQAIRDENNVIFRHVTHPSEANDDIDIVWDLVTSVRSAAGHLDDISRRYDFTSFAAALTKQYSVQTGGQFSWAKLGRDVSVMSRRREQLCTMLGPIGKEIVEKVARKRATKDTDGSNEHVVAQVVSNTASNEESEATNRRIKNLHALVQEEDQFDLLDLLVDRDDPVQTVENFFDFSFLIKEKRASQELVRGSQPCSGLLLSRPLDPEKVGAQLAPKQQVLSMSISDLRLVAELMKEIDDLTKQERNKISVNDKKKGAAGPGLHRLRPSEGERNILHRDDPLYRAENASQQADILAQQASAQQKKASSSMSKRKRPSEVSDGANGGHGLSQNSTIKRGVISSAKKAKP